MKRRTFIQALALAPATTFPHSFHDNQCAINIDQRTTYNENKMVEMYFINSYQTVGKNLAIDSFCVALPKSSQNRHLIDYIIGDLNTGRINHEVISTNTIQNNVIIAFYVGDKHEIQQQKLLYPSMGTDLIFSMYLSDEMHDNILTPEDNECILRFHKHEVVNALKYASIIIDSFVGANLIGMDFAAIKRVTGGSTCKAIFVDIDMTLDIISNMNAKTIDSSCYRFYLLMRGSKEITLEHICDVLGWFSDHPNCDIESEFSISCTQNDSIPRNHIHTLFIYDSTEHKKWQA